MKPQAQLAKTLIASLVTSLAACGGSDPAPASATLVGTAATGAPVQGTVVAVDINGKLSPVATVNSSSGAYTLDVSGMTAPFLLSTTGTSGGRLVNLTSVATAVGQTVNLTPLTDLIVATAAGVTGGGALVDTCTPSAGGNTAGAACLSALRSATTGTRLRDAVQLVSTMIAPLNVGGTDPLNGAFTANGEGLDGVLDRILVTPGSGARATVTLVASQAVIGQLAGPATAGVAGSLTVNQPTDKQTQSANAVALVLPQINACMASLAALYPSTGFKPPTAAQVGPFIADNFNAYSIDRASVISKFISGESPAVAGFKLQPLGLARLDLAPLSSTELTALGTSNFMAVLQARSQGGAPVRLDGAGNPTQAWVRLSLQGGSDGHLFVKAASYTGCPGGWRWAGTQRLDTHMDARVSRDESLSGAASLNRSRAMHVTREGIAEAVAAGLPDIDTVEVSGPGLALYSGNVGSPIGSSAAVTLNRSSNSLISPYVIGGGQTYYGQLSEAVTGCGDLAAKSPNPPAGTPCLDESQAVPGAVYGWTLKATGTGRVVAAFPFEITAVPLSKAFVLANASQLFAQIGQITPASVSAIRTAVAGTTGSVLDGVFSFSYTLGSAYGAQGDNCGLDLYDAAGVSVLRAEANAAGQTSPCRFTTDGLNSGSLAKPANASAITNAYVHISTQVLGNQIVTGRKLPN